MNRTPESNDNRNSPQQNRNAARNGGSHMTPEQRQEYLRRAELQRRAEERRRGERTGYRRRKRTKINIGLTLFLVLICVVLGISFYQIAKNGANSGNNPLPPVETSGETEGLPAETDPVVPDETDEPLETDPPQDEGDLLFDTHSVKSSDINLGDLILVNYQNEYDLTDKIAVKALYGNKTTAYGLSNSSHCLTERVLNAMNKFADAFAADTGCYELVVNSAYRSTADQQSIYDNSVQKNGEEYAKQYVATPGYSEHHTGMAVDLTFYRASEGISIPVAQHPNGGWLKEHCGEYGFIIRYPDDKAEITKISYEPWHFRFVGKPHAAVIMKTGLCLEEYIGLMKSYTLDTKLLHAKEDGTTAEVSVLEIPAEGYIIYFVPASSEETTDIRIPKGYEHYIVSGNNEDGFIVTVYVGQ